MQQPNILYIHSHDTGRYIQPYGHAIATPRLQQLAEEGVLFRQNFCIGPTCSPSRAALLTGCYPHENGMLGLAHRGFALHDYSQHILHTLRKAGYYSALSGVQHITTDEPDAPTLVIGYDECLTIDLSKAHIRAIEFLNRKHEKPFFLSVGFYETHRVFPESHPRDDSRYCLPPPTMPDTPETREDMARFKESARRLDEKVGAVLDALERNGLAENTLVISTTDHGIAFPRMKCTLYDTGVGTSLIMRGPGDFKGGKVINAMTSHLDIFPTLCEYLKIEPPAWLRGKSLIPLVRGDVSELHDALFFEVTYHASYEPMRAVRTDRWKYVRRFDTRRAPVLPNCDKGISKNVWLEHGWRQRTTCEEELFDLVFDPNECCNLADKEEFNPILEELRGRLQKWMKDTHDPLLNGPVPIPKGGIITDPDA